MDVVTVSTTHSPLPPPPLSVCVDTLRVMAVVVFFPLSRSNQASFWGVLEDACSLPEKSRAFVRASASKH